MNELQPAPRGKAEDAWLADLRARFRDVAATGVAADAVEDVVQDAMAVVAGKLRTEHVSGGEGDRLSSAWCFQTLRNVIGDHYRSSRRQRARRVELPDGFDLIGRDPDPMEALAEGQVVEFVVRALDRMGSRADPCARYLTRIAEGVRPADLAREEALDEAVLYRRVYRCRQKLREILHTMGMDV